MNSSLCLVEMFYLESLSSFPPKKALPLRHRLLLLCQLGIQLFQRLFCRPFVAENAADRSYYGLWVLVLEDIAPNRAADSAFIARLLHTVKQLCIRDARAASQDDGFATGADDLPETISGLHSS